MTFNLRSGSIALGVMLLTACASVPNGPSSMALPGSGKSFDQFRYDDGACRQFANDQIGGKTANKAANESFTESAVVGTALGAAIGAATSRGRDAGSGAAIGLFVGSLIGVDSANRSSYAAQRHYDNAYVQCMYAKGHRVPVSGHIEQQPVNNAPLERAPVYAPPPPPPPPPTTRPGNYPPPPPPPGYTAP